MMEDDFLSKDEMEKILSKLPEEDAQRILKHNEQVMKGSKNSAMAAIMAQNLSHGLGSHALSRIIVKK